MLRALVFGLYVDDRRECSLCAFVKNVSWINTSQTKLDRLNFYCRCNLKLTMIDAERIHDGSEITREILGVFERLQNSLLRHAVASRWNARRTFSSIIYISKINYLGHTLYTCYVYYIYITILYILMQIRHLKCGHAFNNHSVHGLYTYVNNHLYTKIYTILSVCV